MSKIIIGQHPTTSYLQYDDVDNKLSLVKIDIETGGQIQSSDIVSGAVAKENVTAFQVFAHDYEIPVGECSELGGYIYQPLSAQMSHKFTIRSTTDSLRQNVTVDWGDGTVEGLSNLTSEVSGTQYKYVMQHTYTQNGKYIVKIKGDTYFAIIQASGSDPNILCRILEEDLPVAQHLKNFSSFVRGSCHLLNVNIKNSNFLTNFTNIALMFYACKNLQQVHGFSTANKINIAYNSVFGNCWNLETTDFCLYPTSYSIKQIFYKCYKLQANLQELFYYADFPVGSTINVTSIFSNCTSLTGTVPAEKLWENKNVIWNNNKTAFANCSDQFRKQIPVSWGGLNESIEPSLSITEQMKLDYTAFQVFAHDYDIAAGTLVKDTPLAIESLTTDTDTIVNALSAQMSHQFKIKSKKTKEEQNIIIDWGDGTIEFLKEHVLSSDSSGFWVKHTYAETGKYIIKIYGNTYDSFVAASNATIPNILSRILDVDLPVASHLTNFSSFASYAKHLLYVNINEENNFNNNWKDCTSMFQACTNLIKATGFKCDNKVNCSFSKIFNNCKALKETDFSISPTNSSLNSVFRNCTNLVADIALLVGNIGYFKDSEISVSQLFYSCKALTGTVPADKLWNNAEIKWVSFNKCFNGTSTTIKSQVPESWGGTASDDIIVTPSEGNLSNKADLVNGKVPAQQLPSYVDDVIEGTIDLVNNTMTDLNGNDVVIEKSKIYIDTTTNKVYRWTGTTFFEISSNVEIPDNIATTGNYVACICSVPPTSIVDGMIWIKGGTISPKYVSSITSPTVVTGQVDPSTCKDFTIIIK